MNASRPDSSFDASLDAHPSPWLQAELKPLPEQHQALSEAELNAALATLPGWRLDAKGPVPAIEATFGFRNYFETIAFVNALAWVCHSLDHHPDLTVAYAKCTVRLHTHTVGGVSVNDLIAAAHIQAVGSQRLPGRPA